MTNKDYSHYRHTPTVTVRDNRGLVVRSISYYRHPDTPALNDERIIRHQFNAFGQCVQSIDPRLFERHQVDAENKPNFTYRASLSGEVLRIESVDAGSTLNLNDINGRAVFRISATSVTRRWQYEETTLAGRLLSISEQAVGEQPRITERFVWAGHSQAEKNLNLAGHYISHYDTAGSRRINSIGLTGVTLSVTRQLLDPGNDADWQGSNESTWKDLLAPDLFTTTSIVDASGALLKQIDAQGHVQRQTYDVAGLLKGSWLTLNDSTEQVILKSLTYSAAGQKLSEEHGNGVVTTYSYEPQTRRLTGIKAERPTGHSSGAKVLQDLRYEYDPVGNVLSLGNDAEETRFWRNQKVVPENRYGYDSLYQLVTASGREMAGITQQGTNLPSTIIPLPTNDGAYTNYTRSYHYDRGGNLTHLCHSASATNNCYTTKMTVSDRSNRTVLSTLTSDPAQVDALFDAGGHQRQLQPGQSLSWTLRGELAQIMPVVREGRAADHETYRYDASSQRLEKLSSQQALHSIQTRRALYLPGLELRTRFSGGRVKEMLHVITVGTAGRAQVRVLHWETGTPEGIRNDSVRYSYDNLIGSSGLELDDRGQIISQEEYYPYGGTAVWAARSQAEASYKTVRYSGKERDATGLYYYGFRYYQPWVGRWLSADPAGTVDGLNLYRMVRNNPIVLADSKGLAPKKPIAGKNADPEVPLLAPKNPQELLTKEYWEKGLNKSQRNEIMKVDFWKQKFPGNSKGKPRTLDNILSTVGPKLLKSLDDSGNESKGNLSLFRSMDPVEAKGVMSWQADQKINTEIWIKGGQAKADAFRKGAEPGTGILPIKNHLGDKEQAQRYKTEFNIMLEFKLKPGSGTLLFTPDYLAIARAGKGASRAIVSQLGSDYQAASTNEGVLSGYIGMKSEEHGPFSLGVGDSDPSRLLFQLMVDNIKEVVA